jgi:hypothetical protein
MEPIDGSSKNDLLVTEEDDLVKKEVEGMGEEKEILVVDNNMVQVIPSSAPKLRLVDGICVIFGLMVGSGIFSSAGLIYADVGSSGMSLLIWLGTGLLALTGALWYNNIH